MEFENSVGDLSYNKESDSYNQSREKYFKLDLI